MSESNKVDAGESVGAAEKGPLLIDTWRDAIESASAESMKREARKKEKMALFLAKRIRGHIGPGIVDQSSLSKLIKYLKEEECLYGFDIVRSATRLCEAKYSDYVAAAIRAIWHGKS